MRKRYLPLLLAAFMLLGQIAGTEPLVYAEGETEVTSGEEDGTGANFDWLEDSIGLLPGWEHEISRENGSWFVKDENYPDGREFPMEIIDIELTSEEATEGPDAPVELYEDNNGWRLVAQKVGRAHIKVTGKIAVEEGDITPDDAEKTAFSEADVIVSNQVYSLDVSTNTGTDCLLPGSSIRLHADVSLECWDERDGYYPGDTSDVSVKWNINSEHGTGQVLAEGMDYQVDAEELEGEEEYDISVGMHVMAGGKEVINRSYGLYVRNQYYVLEPGELPGAENLWPKDGKTVPVEPKLYRYEKNGGEDGIPEENVQYKFDYNPENFIVEIADGTEVASGELLPATASEFTIGRQQNADDRIRIEAYMQGEEELEYRSDREWWFYWQDYENIRFENTREDNYSWIYVGGEEEWENDDETAMAFTLNTDNIGGEYQVEWKTGIGEEAEGEYPFEADSANYEISGNTFTITDAEAMKADIRTKLGQLDGEEWNGGFQLSAIVKNGEEVLSRRDMWVEFRTPGYQLEDDDAWDMLPTMEFIYEGKKVSCYVENKEHPYGEEVELDIVNLLIQQQNPDGGTAGEVFSKTESGNDIRLSAQNYGQAILAYQVRFPSGQEKTFIRDKYVSGDIYRFGVWSSTGTTYLFPGENLQVESEVNHGHYNEETKEPEWEILESGYKMKYQGYDENLISVDENGLVTAKGEYGGTGVDVVLWVPEEAEGNYERWSWLPINVVDLYYRVSAGEVFADAGESVDSIDWKWVKCEKDSPDAIEEAEGSYRLEPAEGIQLNEEGTGFTVDSDVKDGQKIEIWLTARIENEDGSVKREGEGSVTLTICNHDFSKEVEVLKAATCTEEGSRTLECTKCHNRKTEVIPKTSHKAGEWSIAKQPSCTAEGSREQKCTVCGAVVNTGAITKTGHKAGEWSITKQPSCTVAGTQEQRCTVCNTVLGTKSIPAAGHSFGEWKETTKATALREGVQTRTCKVCSAAETKSTGKLKATIKLNAKKIPLQVKKSTTAVKVISMTEGDSIKSWKSSNSKIASVTSKGKITGKKTGTAKITVTLKSGISAKVTVKVQKKAVTTTKLTVTGKSLKKNKLTLKKGKSLTLAATRTPITSTDKVTYKSSNKKIVTVSGKGKVTAKKAGKAKVTVTSGKKKVVITVTVKK